MPSRAVYKQLNCKSMAVDPTGTFPRSTPSKTVYKKIKTVNPHRYAPAINATKDGAQKTVNPHRYAPAINAFQGSMNALDTPKKHRYAPAINAFKGGVQKLKNCKPEQVCPRQQRLQTQDGINALDTPNKHRYAPAINAFKGGMKQLDTPMRPLMEAVQLPKDNPLLKGMGWRHRLVVSLDRYLTWLLGGKR
jgi:hypothetical protein